VNDFLGNIVAERRRNRPHRQCGANPGFSDPPTLTSQLINHSDEVRQYFRGERPAQTKFSWMDRAAVRPDNERYQDWSDTSTFRI
jgi:hypothetical protein